MKIREQARCGQPKLDGARCGTPTAKAGIACAAHQRHLKAAVARSVLADALARRVDFSDRLVIDGLSCVCEHCPRAIDVARAILAGAQ